MTVVALGADHAGFALKEVLKGWLIAQGYDVVDLGTQSAESVDYPDFAIGVGGAITAGKADRGVLVCGTGIGVSIAANKIAGVRAATVHDVTSAHLAREHNNANVVCFGERLIGYEVAREALDAFVDTTFAGGRHQSRVAKIDALLQ